jgi:hypothetical protein
MKKGLILARCQGFYAANQQYVFIITPIFDLSLPRCQEDHRFQVPLLNKSAIQYGGYADIFTNWFNTEADI